MTMTMTTRKWKLMNNLLGDTELVEIGVWQHQEYSYTFEFSSVACRDLEYP